MNKSLIRDISLMIFIFSILFNIKVYAQHQYVVDCTSLTIKIDNASISKNRKYMNLNFSIRNNGEKDFTIKPTNYMCGCTNDLKDALSYDLMFFKTDTDSTFDPLTLLGGPKKTCVINILNLKARWFII